MDYRTGKVGRLIVIRFDDGDDFLQELINVVKKENIRAAYFTMIGGLRRALENRKSTCTPPLDTTARA
jgi:predicted DNA-binding protein with PD1-like motif